MRYTSPGLVEEIIQELKGLLEKEENIGESNLWLDYGKALMNAYKYEDALEAYKRSLELKDTIKGHLNLGVALKSLGEFEKALDEFFLVLKDNKYPDVYYKIAECYKNMERTDDAIAYYMKALDINPSYVEALYSLGELYRQMGMLEETLEIYKKIIDDNIILKQDFVDLTLVHYDLAYLYTKNSLFDEAIKHLEKVAFKHPEYADVHFKLGRLYKSKGWLDKAMAEFEKAIRINPNYKEARDEYWDL